MPAQAPQTYRFIADSTQQAVEILRTQLGPQAHVLSVRQVNSSGWKRFICAPKIEVTATQQLHQQECNLREVQSDEPALPPLFLQESSEQSTVATQNWLSSVGWPQALIAQLKTQREWTLLEQTSAPKERLTLLYHWIAREYNTIPSRPLTNRIAVLGTSSVGKTTALCKWLSSFVFSKGQPAQVLTVQASGLECSQRLEIFCQALGVFLGKASIDSALINDHSALLVDTPGFSLVDSASTKHTAQALDELGVDTRILCLNATCESETMQQTLRAAQGLRPTHLFFSHVDEIGSPLRLWSVLLGQRLPVAGIGLGPSLTHQLSEDPFDALIERTFPQAIIN